MAEVHMEQQDTTMMQEQEATTQEAETPVEQAPVQTSHWQPGRNTVSAIPAYDLATQGGRQATVVLTLRADSSAISRGTMTEDAAAALKQHCREQFETSEVAQRWRRIRQQLEEAGIARDLAEADVLRLDAERRLAIGIAAPDLAMRLAELRQQQAAAQASLKAALLAIDELTEVEAATRREARTEMVKVAREQGVVLQESLTETRRAASEAAYAAVAPALDALAAAHWASLQWVNRRESAAQEAMTELFSGVPSVAELPTDS